MQVSNVASVGRKDGRGEKSLIEREVLSILGALREVKALNLQKDFRKLE